MGVSTESVPIRPREAARPLVVSSSAHEAKRSHFVDSEEFSCASSLEALLFCYHMLRQCIFCFGRKHLSSSWPEPAWLPNHTHNGLGREISWSSATAFLAKLYLCKASISFALGFGLDAERQRETVRRPRSPPTGKKRIAGSIDTRVNGK